MSKTNKAVAEVMEPQDVNPSTVMTVVKSSDQIEQVVTPNISDVILKVKEQWHLSQMHANLSGQIDKLKAFKSEINETTSLLLTNYKGGQFQSNDPIAVESLIDLCISNVNKKISEIEANLLNQ
jgi:hypothetical protein